jgi:DNA-binding GntR family transcriptional regulator
LSNKADLSRGLGAYLEGSERDDVRRAGVVQYFTKAEAAYTELRRRILDGSVSPESTLKQEQLASEFGISTTPLREALRRLESEGLVKLAAHKEVIVSPVDNTELIDLYEVREQLDALAARLAAERHDSDEATRIAAARDALLGSPSAAPLRLNRFFHRSIYIACHNVVLIDALESLWDRSDRHRRILHPVALDREVVDEHMALADAVLEGDGERASALMARHVRDTLEAIQQLAVTRVST